MIDERNDLVRFIVTAAHCLAPDSLDAGDELDDITVTLGMVDIDDDLDNRLQIKAKKNVRVSHYRFAKNFVRKRSEMTHDIALLELVEPVSWDDYPHIRSVT